jgi:hypothetical protein
MELLTDILKFVGFLTITFGAAGHISRWLKENDERKRTLEKHNASVMGALSRIEATLNNNDRNHLS